MSDDSVLVLIAAMAIFLTHGEPSVYDGIVNWLMVCK